MKKCIIKLSALLLVCCAMLGCGKEDNPGTPIVKFGSIFGTVTDFVTGDPVSNANVRLNPRGETTLTGSDGTFQFNDVGDGEYSLSLSKNGYVDLDDDYVIEIENGNNVRRDVQLCSEFESFKITVNGVETDTLYFSVDNTCVTFLVTNTGTKEIDVYGSVSSGNGSTYITLGYYDNGNFDFWTHSVIQPNFGCPVIVCFDVLSKNTGYVYLNSAQISKTLVCIRR